VRSKIPDVKEQISSPCKKECKLKGVCCSSCGRSLEDIRLWKTYSESKRKQIMEELSNGKDG